MLPKKCKLCGSGELAVVSNIVYGDETGEKSFFGCKNCEVIFQHPFFSKQEEEFFYNSQFEKYMSNRSGDNEWEGPESHISLNGITFDRRQLFLEKWMDQSPSRESILLEIGCSSGFMLLPYKKKGYQVIGVEPSNIFSAYLDSQNVKVVPDLKCLDSDSVDVIFHFFVMEHIVDVQEWFKEQLRILKPGGQIIVEVPCGEDPLRTVYNNKGFDSFYWSVVHPWYFNEKSVRWLLKELSYKSLEVINYQRYGIKNHMHWEKTGKPGGNKEYLHISDEVDNLYKKSLEKSGKTDTLLLRIMK
jgi:SAM-dependent methyltransferase